MIHQQNSKDVVLIASQAITSAQTNTANLDTMGADYATIRINLGVEKNSSGVGPTISLKESDDTVVTNFATFNTDFSITGAADDLAAAKEVLWHVDTKSRKRYLRLTVNTGTATNDDIVIGAVATLGRLANGPASTSGMVNTTNDIVKIG